MTSYRDHESESAHGEFDPQILPTEYKKGEPCSMGCAAHVSEPCESCGRYAAGNAAGPGVFQVVQRIRRSDARLNPVIAACVEEADRMGMSEQQLLALSYNRLLRLFEHMARTPEQDRWKESKPGR